MKQYPHKELATVQMWITPIGGQEHWMLYGGRCEWCEQGTLWLWTEGHVMLGVAQCDQCNGSKTWDIEMDNADWVSWALDAIAGRLGQQQIAHADPPSMLHHTMIP